MTGPLSPSPQCVSGASPFPDAFVTTFIGCAKGGGPCAGPTPLDVSEPCGVGVPVPGPCSSLRGEHPVPAGWVPPCPPGEDQRPCTGRSDVHTRAGYRGLRVSGL